MGRSVASVRLQLNELIEKIERAKNLMKKEERVYADKIVEAIKKRYSVCYYAFDSAEEAVLFSIAVELMRSIDYANSGRVSGEEWCERLDKRKEDEEKAHQARRLVPDPLSGRTQTR